MNRILVALLLTSGLSAQAEVAVYRIAVSYTRIGDEAVRNSTVGGYLLLDLGTTNVVVLRVDPVKKQFHENVPSVSLANVNSSAVNTYAVVKFRTGDLVSAMAKGPNASVTVNYDSQRHPINTAIPVVLTVGGCDLLSSATGEKVTRDYRGSIILDRATTLNANKIGADASSYSSVLQVSLLSRGYVQSP
ncbi:MAG: hypothetical protein JWO95_119 [Verrucomicrobiales bacterium]|nr:hypothetical protein [Verrucomicrobiales bacterium]